MRIAGLSLAQGEDERIPWRATRSGGVFWFPLHLEEGEGGGVRAPGPDRGGATVLIRMDPGRGYAPHRHVGSEDVLVLQGGYRDEFGEHHCGDHVHYAAGSRHSPVALGDGTRPPGPANPACILYATAPLGIELLD